MTEQAPLNFDESLLRQLAELEPGEPPILSIYLDMRPHAVAEKPGERTSLIILRDRLREIASTLEPHTPAQETFTASTTLAEAYLASELAPEIQGLAIFACEPRSLFETITVAVPFENQVVFAPRPALFQLARLLDDHETAVVAIVDSNTTRLFVTSYGALDEVGGPNDKNTKYYRHQSMGGWSQRRYQSHNEWVRESFAREAAAAIEELVNAVSPTRVIIAGDEVAVPLLQNALSPQVSALLHEDIVRLDIRTQPAVVQQEVAPMLTAAEADESRAVADRLIEAIRADSLGVGGLKRTRRALENGQVDTLLIAADAELDETTRDELIALAATTSATVEVVEGHGALRNMAVGGLLRYRYEGGV